MEDLYHERMVALLWPYCDFLFFRFSRRDLSSRDTQVFFSLPCLTFFLLSTCHFPRFLKQLRHQYLKMLTADTAS